MSKHHRLKTTKPKGLLREPKSEERKAQEIELAKQGLWLDPKAPQPEKVPLNFLLNCSEGALGTFELARLAEVANLRAELHAIFDRMLDAQSLAGLSAWFRSIDRNALKHSLENPPDIVAQAKAEIRRREGRPEEREQMPSPSLFRPSLPPGAAHLAAAMRYQERNLAEGKCCVCPEPLDRNSVRYCTEHLKQARERIQRKKGGRSKLTKETTCSFEPVAKPKLEVSLAIPDPSKEQLTDLRFNKRRLAEGLCLDCPEPVAPGHRYCKRHLEDKRWRATGKPKLEKYLSGEKTGRGRKPGKT